MAGCASSPKSITAIEEPVVIARCARCTNDVRSVSRLENEAVLDRMAERLTWRPEILDRRREVVEHPRQHQAMDASGRLSHARPRQRARRVQPDGARLQFAPRPQHPRRQGDDRRRRGLRRRRSSAHREPIRPLRPHQTDNGGESGRNSLPPPLPPPNAHPGVSARSA